MTGPLLAALMLSPAQLPKSAGPPEEKNLRAVVLAVHNYEAAMGGFPPPGTGVQGKPGKLLSWRVAVLPFLNQQKLYQEFKPE